MKTFLVDLETTNNGPDGSPEAHWPQNRVLWWGWATNGHNIETSKDPKDFYRALMQFTEHDQVVIAGHNLKFDLKYMMREWPDVSWIDFNYYCTMYGEYRMSGHKNKFMGLEDACKSRGIPFTKGLDLKTILASGVKMEDIPDSDLEPYLVDDVDATRKLLLAQLMNSKEEVSHDHILALTHMELVGMQLDKPHTESLARHLVSQEQVALSMLEGWTCFALRKADGSQPTTRDFKITAPRTISYMLTGHPVTGVGKKGSKHTIAYQAGQLPMLTPQQIKAIWGNIQPTNLGYPMPADKLKQVSYLLPYAVQVLAYRGVQKMLGTYIGPFLEKTKDIPTIHSKMHMVSTGTGRLSSADPNGQNSPPEARECFTSRWGDLMEIDFKQLEMVGVAAIAQDQQLIDDLNNGVDVHFETGKSVMNWKIPADMNTKDRTIVKNVNFGILYGGGANGLATQTGQPIPLIKQLIASFYKRYPRIKVWQAEFYTAVTKNLKPAGFINGEQVYDSEVVLAQSKRRFYFKESKSPKWLAKITGRGYSFKPTETKNYPIQGFAGGDIVMSALTRLHRRLWSVPFTEIVMTVHDSILVDTALEENIIDIIMKEICEQVEQEFSLPCKLEFKITAGTNWK